MSTIAERVDHIVKESYKNIFAPTVRKFGLEYEIKKLYSQIMAFFVDTTTVTVDDISCKFAISMREYLIFRLADLGGERPVVTDFLDTVQSEDIVYDIGAFVGMYSIFAAKLGVDVVAFEPNPNNYDRFVENIKINNISNIDIHSIALGRKTETTRLQSNSIIDHRSQITQEETGDVVQCLRGDEFINKENRSMPDIMKIDVEGAELAVLDGFGSALSSCRVIYCEAHTEIVDLDELISKLEENGFESKIIHERTDEVFIKAT